jgi:hypothetical protein
MAAREELAEALDNELENLKFAENQRRHKNEAVVWALRGAGVPGLEWAAADFYAYDAARAAFFPTEGREDLTDPDTLAYDYGRHEGDGPVEWWSDERCLLLYFMRRASGEGLPRLMRDLEGLRERVTVQLALAERDLDRRYVPRGEGGGRVADQERSLFHGPGSFSGLRPFCVGTGVRRDGRGRSGTTV